MIRRDDLHRLRILYVRFARPYTPALLLGVVLSAVAAMLAALQPLVLAPMIDAAGLQASAAAQTWSELTLNNIGPSLLAWTGFGHLTSKWAILGVVVASYVGLVVLTNVADFGNRLFIAWVRAGLFRDLQATVYRHVLGLSMGYFSRQRTGDLASRIMHDTMHTAPSVDAVVRDMFQGTVHLGIYAFLLVRTDAWLTAGLAVVFAAHLAITRGLRDRVRRVAVDQFDFVAQLTGLIHEAFVGIRVVKSFVAETFEHQRFLERSRNLARVLMKFDVYKYVDQPLREIADALGLGLVLVMAFVALANGRLTVSGLVLFVVLARLALHPVSRVARGLLSVQNLLAASKGLLDLLDVPASVQDGARTAAPLREGLRLENVRFAYRPGLEVLRDVSLEIRRGEMVALVGPSGAGKSTLADLVVRLYDPTGGRVVYDGADVRDFSQASYRRQFGVVSQECLLFNASVVDNIAYGRPVDRDMVRKAAEVAHADEFIARLPEAYDAIVGDRGIRLSGGQRQRIAIARALYGQPAVLVLDEATSSLDSESEGQVQAAIEEVVGSVTALVIAHRLSTVTRADRIVVLDDGRVEAEGTHEELLVRSALYRRLCEAQFGDGALAPARGGA